MSSASSSSENSESPSMRPRKRRCNHPKATTEYLIRWVRDHIVEPYPTEEEKTSLSQKVNLTPKQLEDWFTNLRRRKLEKIRKDMGIDLYSVAHQMPTKKRHSARQFENYSRPHIKKHSPIKRQSTSNEYLENNRTESSRIDEVTCSNQPGVSLIKRSNSLSSLNESSNDMNTSSFVENDSNLRLLCWVALNSS
nr:homeobox protein CUP9 [Parasteatoda tepidariorum]